MVFTASTREVIIKNTNRQDEAPPNEKLAGKTKQSKRKVLTSEPSPTKSMRAKMSKQETHNTSVPETQMEWSFKTLNSKKFSTIINNEPVKIDIQPMPKNEAKALIERIIIEASKSNITRSDIEGDTKPEWFPSSLLWDIACVFEEALKRLSIEDKATLNLSMDSIKKNDPWLGFIVKKTLWSAVTSTSANSEFGLDGKQQCMADNWVKHGLARQKFEIDKDWLKYQIYLCPKESSSKPVFNYKPASRFSEQWTEQNLGHIGMSIDDIRIDEKPESQPESLWCLLEATIDNLKICNEKQVDPLSETVTQDLQPHDLTLLRKLLHFIFSYTPEGSKDNSGTISGDTTELDQDRQQLELMLDNVASRDEFKAFKNWREWVETCPETSKQSGSASVLPSSGYNLTI